jgi:2-polyprenyl-6-methoxyphenol hydroxylase-like FAD-dependent oxidoreductase
VTGPSDDLSHRHCASPFSGMGTTLAMVGAYNLAGALTQYASETPLTTPDFASIFSEYETATRPLVTKAQKLPPGMPWLIHPQTSWGVWIMRTILRLVQVFGLDTALAKLASRGKDTSSEESEGKLVEWDRR